MKRISFLIIILTLLKSVSAQTVSIYPIFPGSEAMGMGYAYTALARNATALFWNPAHLASIPTHQIILSGYGFQTPEMDSTYFASNFLALSYQTYRYGGWGLGSYSSYLDTNHTTIALGWGYRINRFIKTGLTLSYRYSIHPNYQFTMANFTGSVGFIFQPNQYVQMGYLLQSPLQSFFFSQNSPSDSLAVWRQKRMGLALFPAKFLTITTDMDLLRGTQHFGVGIQFSPEFVIRGGVFAPHLLTRLRNRDWQNVRIGVGVTLGNPGITISATQYSQNDYFFSVQLQLNLGQPRRPFAVRQRVYSYSLPAPAGIHIVQTPNPLIYLPTQINSPPIALPSTSEDNSRQVSFIDSVVTPAIAGGNTSNAWIPPSPLPGGIVSLHTHQWATLNQASTDTIIYFLQQSVKLNRHFWPAYQQLALMYLGLHKFETAYHYIQRAQQFAAFQEPVVIPVMLYTAFLQGTRRNSFHTLSPTPPMPVLAAAALIEYHNKNFRRSLELLNRLPLRWQKYPSFLFYNGLAYYQNSFFTQIPSAWHNLIENYPHHPYAQLAQILANHTDPVPPAFVSNPQSSIQLIDGGTARLIQPTSFQMEDQSHTFPNTIGRVYVWVKLKNIPASGTRIVPVWYWQNQQVFVGTKGLRVGPSGRTYGYKTILPYQTGLWRVDFFVKNTREYIGSVYFRIKNQGEIS